MAAAPTTYKHFSHAHALAVHHTAPGSDVHCSGCKSRAAGCVYACWACNYFLDQQCFAAARSMLHPAHPTHPLTLLPYPTYASASFFCNACGLAGDAFCYCCSDCEFDVHVRCAAAHNPNAAAGLGYTPHTGSALYPPPVQTGALFPTPM
ncbi:uncharacterized protein LOC127246258 [Andrographis paniculata]|uniref:uncharacterized protein LOC127246258 n=1 Tax=Andrographis paniculata TaxID=175694 RepID=UPI0021E96544|nr:uncharacterized protein LOC127246258 [Andrographis paniculata]